MQVHKDISNLPVFKNAAITIGTFDGVHKGHSIIIRQLITEARELHGESIIITFHPHPRKVVGLRQADIRLLNTEHEKIELLATEGIDHLVIVPFTDVFSQQTAVEYVEQFLVKYFQPKCIIIGYDHRFGHNREGNYHLLESLQEKFGYELIEIPERLLNDITISSTIIRNSIINSQVEIANDFLGYPYFFEATVVEGNKLGRTIGYPTANLRMNDSDKLLPGNGVYAVRIRLTDIPHAHWHNGMMNIGVRPTLNGTTLTVEVNIFNFDEDIYHRTVRVEVIYHLRGEQKFAGLDALKMQLGLDKLAAMEKLVEAGYT